MPLDQYGRYVCETTPGPEPATDVSPPGALIALQVACGHGPPTHTPVVAAQIYTDVDDGTEYNYTGALGWLPPPP